MSVFHRARWLVLSSCALAVVSTGSAWAQGTQGFSRIARPAVTGDEATSQDELWALEVQLRPLRMIRVPLTDPKTGKKSEQLVLYQVYRVITRPVERPQDTSDRKPVNDQDPLPGRPLLIPEFTLVTRDNDQQKVYADQILPEAVAAIEKRERLDLRDAIEMIGPIPEPTPYDSDTIKTRTGVATWVGVDPDADRFTVYLTGFSNGFQRGKGPDGQPVTLRRTLVQDYWRPGDRFDQNEREIRPQGEPHWIYRPDEAPTVTAPQPPAADAPQ